MNKRFLKHIIATVACFAVVAASVFPMFSEDMIGIEDASNAIEALPEEMAKNGAEHEGVRISSDETEEVVEESESQATEELLDIPIEERLDYGTSRPYESYAPFQTRTKQSLYSKFDGSVQFPARYIAKRAKIQNTQVGGWCWAYGTLQAAESNILTNNIVQGASESTFDLSEKHLVYFSALPDLSYYEQNERGLWGCGSTQELASNTLLNWMGPVFFDDEPVESGPAYGDYSISYPQSDTKYNSVAHLQNVKFTGSLNTEDIKYLIMRYGAVIVNRLGLHAVTYLGWNDDAFDGEGGFILRDNHEDYNFSAAGNFDFDNIHQYGYYDYSPYEEPYIADRVIALDFEPTDNYDHNYFHSENMTLEDMELQPEHPSNNPGYETQYLASFSIGEESDCNNLHPSGGMETIEAIGAYVRYEDIDVSYEIRKNSQTGQLLASGTQYIDYAGYYTIPLEQKITVSHGDNICVIFKSDKRHAIGGGIEFPSYGSLEYSIKPHDESSGKCMEYGVFTQSNHLGLNTIDLDLQGTPSWHASNCDLIIHMYTSDTPWTLNTEGLLTQNGTCIVPAGGEVRIPYTGEFIGNETFSKNGHFKIWPEETDTNEGLIHIEALTSADVASEMIVIEDSAGNSVSIPGMISTGIGAEISCNLSKITMPFTEQYVEISRNEAYLYAGENGTQTQAVNYSLLSFDADSTSYTNNLIKELPQIVLTNENSGEAISKDYYTTTVADGKVVFSFKMDSPYAGHAPFEVELETVPRDISGLNSWGKEYIRLSDNTQLVNRDQTPVRRLYNWGIPYALKGKNFLLYNANGNFIRINEANFDIEMQDNTNAGTAKIHVKAKAGSNYTGEADITFPIEKIRILSVYPEYDASSITSAAQGEVLEALPSKVSIGWKKDPKNLQQQKTQLTIDNDYTISRITAGSNQYISNYEITFSNNFEYEAGTYKGQIVAATGGVYDAIAGAPGVLWEDKVKNAVRVGSSVIESISLADHISSQGELKTSISDPKWFEDFICLQGLFKGVDYEVECLYDGPGTGTIVIRDLETGYEEKIEYKIYLTQQDLHVDDPDHHFDYIDESRKKHTVTYNLYSGETEVKPQVDAVYVQSEAYNNNVRVDLNEGTDYAVTYSYVATTADPYDKKAVITFTSPLVYPGTELEMTYNERPVTINDADVAFEGSGTNGNIFDYDGNAITPIPALTFTDCANPKALAQGTDFEIVGYKNNTDPGVAAVTIKDRYTEATRSLPFYIRRRVTSENVTLDSYSFRYKGSAIKPQVTITIDGEKIPEALYTVTYANNTAPADADEEMHPYVTIMMDQNSSYYGTLEIPFTIRGDYITSDMVTLSSDAFAYTGKEIKPKVTVKDENKTLKEKKDYTLVYSNNVNPALADAYNAPTVTVKGMGKYTRQADVTFAITRPISAFEFEAIAPQPVTLDYSGGIIPTRPKVTVKADKTGLSPKGNIDYTLYYYDNNRIGKSSILVVGNGLYEGTKTLTYQTVAADVNTLRIKDIPDETYDGSIKTPDVEVVYVKGTGASETELPLTKGRDYTVKYTANKDNGTATVTITGKGSFKGTATKTFNILKKNVADLDVEVQDAAYTGKEAKPAVKVSFRNAAGKTVTLGKKDFTVTYKNNVNGCEIMTSELPQDSMPTVTIEGKGNYEGTKDARFSIAPLLASKMTVSLKKKAFTYTGSPVKFDNQITVTVKDGRETKELSQCTNYEAVKAGEESEYNGDYLLSYENNVNAGKKAVVRVKGIRNFAGYKDTKFAITAKNAVAGISVTNIQDQTFTGAALKPFEAGEVIVTDSDTHEPLELGKDYTVAYKGNINPGTATATLTGKGNYTGKIQAEFRTNWIIWDSDHITVEPASPVYYTGTKQAPAVKVWFEKDGERLLLNSKGAYKLVYEAATKTGTYKVSATPDPKMVKKGYITGTGAVEGTFTIEAKNIKELSFTSIPAQTLKKDKKTGKVTPAAPALTIKNGKNKLILNKDYVITFADNAKAGKAAAVITGIGGYEGTKTLYFFVK